MPCRLLLLQAPRPVRVSHLLRDLVQSKCLGLRFQCNVGQSQKTLELEEASGPFHATLVWEEYAKTCIDIIEYTTVGGEVRLDSKTDLETSEIFWIYPQMSVPQFSPTMLYANKLYWLVMAVPPPSSMWN